MGNTLLCLTVRSHKMMLLHLSQEYSTTWDVIQIAEPLFCHRDKKSMYLASH